MSDKGEVVVRLSNTPAETHLIEVYGPNGAQAIIQISSTCSRASVCEVAAAIQGAK